MKRTGELLKKAREDKKLSLHEIGLSLKISSKVLRAIESGDETQLPAKTFLRGFVQSYANFLGLPVDQVLDLFYEEMGSTKPKPYIRPLDVAPSVSTASQNPEETHRPPSEIPSPASLGRSKDVQSLNQSSSKKTIAVFVIGAVLVGLILFTKRMIDKYAKEAEVPQEEIAQTIEGATPVITDGPVTEGLSATSEQNMSVNPEAQVTASATPVISPVSSPASTPLATPATTASATPVQTASPTPTVTASPKATASPVVSPTGVTNVPAAVATASPTVTPTASPTATPAVMGTRPVELIVEALDAVEIEYSAPNGKLQKIRLSPEQVHTFKSRSGLSIQFSNGGAVNLILNGKDVGIPGDLGRSIRLSY